MTLTIRDIAEMAGVSKATVSKVINHYEGVNEQTKRKVMRIIEKTGYQPTFSAKSLATNKSGLIGLIYAGETNVKFNHPFFSEVISTFQKNIVGLGYDIIIFSNEPSIRKDVDYLARCRHFRLDGCLIVAGEEIEQAVMELDQSEIPCVGIDIKLYGKNSAFVMTDNLMVSQLAVEHVYEVASGEIAFIAGKKTSEISNLRLEGFLRAMKQYKQPIRPEWIAHGDFFENSGYEIMKHILQSREVPKAVIAASDMMALGAMRAIKETGRRIPKDIKVVGCDDVEACRYSEPTLSTVKQDKQELGRIAAKKLNDLITKEECSEPSIVKPELVIRHSSMNSM